MSPEPEHTGQEEGSSGVINVGALEAQLVTNLGAQILRQLQPSIDHTDKAAESTRRRVTYGGGSVVLLLVALLIYVRSEYKDFERGLGERDKQLAASVMAANTKLGELDTKLGTLTERLGDQDAVILELKRELNRKTRTINDLSRAVWKSRAEPVSIPFPDVTTQASPRM